MTHGIPLLVASAFLVCGARAASAQGAPALVRDARTVDPRPAPPLVFEGIVIGGDGASAAGAVVVTSAGGRAVTDPAGCYRLEIEALPGAKSVDVTAVARVGNENLVASATVALPAPPGPTRLAPLVLVPSASCPPSWLPTFEIEPGFSDGTVRALTVFDDGSGPALYAGGSCSRVAGVAIYDIAKWDGERWSPVGGGVGGQVNALAVFDDGSGPALYVGGTLSSAGGVVVNRIARWDGTSWSGLGAGLSGTSNGQPSSVDALAVHDDGTGPALYAGGNFHNSGPTTVTRIAKWNGTSWSALGNGTNGRVLALTSFDNGTGARLFVGGSFSTAGIVSCPSGAARWNGTSWTALGSGGGSVQALTVFDSGGGPAVHAGGAFTPPGGALTRGVAKWTVAGWSMVGSGMSGSSVTVRALTVLDDGGGPALFATGTFASAGGAAANSIAKWHGGNWSALGSGFGSEYFSNGYALAVFDDGEGPALHAGGDFLSAGGTTVNRIASWTSPSWKPLGDGLSNSVYAVAAFDDGNGPALYAGGGFMAAGGVNLNCIGRWDGSHWSPLGSGMNAEVVALEVFDDGSGPQLYAAGAFTLAGGVAAGRIARWDGTSWSALGSDLPGSPYTLEVFDDGGGPALYAGGWIESTGGVHVGILRWNGSTWTGLGSGVSGGTHPTTVRDLEVFDDGSGPALYVAGNFLMAGGMPASRIAKWDGSAWSALGSGLGGGWWAPYVHDLAVFDDGSGPALYAGGQFTSAGGVPAQKVARWDGTSWSALGTEILDGYDVYSLAMHDDGRGPALFAAGDFTSAGAMPMSRLGRWDGTSWSALGGGCSDAPTALASIDVGTGPALFVTGSAFDSGDSYLSKWGCPLGIDRSKVRRR